MTVLFDSKGEQFAWYAIGLLVGMAVFLVLRLIVEVPRAKKNGDIPSILGDPDSLPPKAALGTPSPDASAPPARRGGGIGRD